jgi:AcrR family transcriptional regulator
VQTSELRRDAARNRDVLIRTARQVFAEQGLDAPLDEISRRARIGNATLYRRFPTRADLVVAVFADRMREHVRVAEAALRIADPWDGFAGFVREIASLQARDRGIADLVTMDLSSAPEIEQLRAAAFAGLVELAARAKAAGALRADFVPEDIVVLLMANAGLLRRAHEAGPQASARLVHVLLDGLRAASATAGPKAPSRPRVRQAMRQQSHELRLGPLD